MTDDRMRLELTAHPLQRIGAYALSVLARCPDPQHVTPEALDRAMAEMTGHAVAAALVRDTKREDAFWLKSSLSFFPNSPMNHPSNGKKSDAQIEEAVRRWRTMPEPAEHLEVACVLCGRQAVKYFGKVDVPLAESHIYRNTTPRGHEGMALCWPCVCSFYALPYGCRLTGKSAIALHSWDERFLARTVSRQVGRNRRLLAMGSPKSNGPRPRETVALWALRHYGESMTAGVELLVFSNNNKGQSLEIYALEQPLAEWLRRTSQLPQRRQAFKALLRAHRSGEQPGMVELARNAFHAPEEIVSACAHYLAARVDGNQVPGDAVVLAELCFSFVVEVMDVNEKDLAEIRSTAARVAALLTAETSGGRLKEFYATLKEPRRMRSWLQRRAVDWALVPPKEDMGGPLMTARAFELFFDPGSDNPAWFHRQMLLVAVLEELHRRGWKPQDGEQVAKELAAEDELHEVDRLYADGEEEA